MEYFILAKDGELAAIPVDRKLYSTYKKLGYRFIDKTRSCDKESALMHAKRKYKSNTRLKWGFGLATVFLAYWAYFYTLLT